MTMESLLPSSIADSALKTHSMFKLQLYYAYTLRMVLEG